VELACRWCLTCEIEDQYTDLLPVVGAVQKLLFGKYLDLSVAGRRGFLFVAIFQAKLMMRLLLIRSMSLIPRPP
jgi:hypothetical protein